ncbi:phytoene synthase [Ectothiorhodospira haloalkaliphila]|uniref:Phytoene synthase n=1 Tax=Ectothiorhodospira haloalkaliphila TaxID=421628 RepID=W8KI59_9GAMM|nr:phytoene/squalene synthase family protein [Ectothiorhodospira haloalkaliphila]AHK79489.1 phytoene synthase [Ectothiorhodospira haloalkaliphila]
MMQATPKTKRPTRAADMAACRSLLCDGSRSFYAASLFLPRQIREPATAMYAFCRLADDAIDLDDGRGDGLERMQDRLDRIYEGKPRDFSADRAFARVVQRFSIPKALPQALLEGFEWDTGGRTYPDLASLEAYGARVAGTVGAMMTLVMGVRSPDALARACDMGVAMQLTNIARDVGEDARNGRIYLPLNWMEEHGIDVEAFLADPKFTPEIGQVVQRLLEAADRLYERGAVGVQTLPPSCRPGIQAAMALYSEIGREVERNGLDSINQRAVVSPSRKIWALTQMFRRFSDKQLTVMNRILVEEPLEANRFLVDAVREHPFGRESIRPTAMAMGRVEHRLMWLHNLFHRLEERDRSMRMARKTSALARNRDRGDVALG